ncbi:unnamed protein product [Echinostoma caproni]|uniref:Reverse transcriptase domain-containing protein n=1 Tax=Echinostoma caproni TaxID=27848 RepID=A0A183A7H4_9TREM|nr:unnamed protein product [Echinostoma caproni]
MRRSHYTRLIREDKVKYQEAIAQKFISNSKLLYQQVNSIRKVKFGIPVLSSAGRVAATPTEAAQMLKIHYSNIFAAPQIEDLQVPHRLHHPPHPSLTYVSFTAENVKAKLMALLKYATPGVDNIHPASVIFLANHISEPLAILFQRMFDQATLPESWRQGVISPIYKGGCRSPAFGVIESHGVNCGRFSDGEPQRYNILSNAQHGFRQQVILHHEPASCSR